MSLRFEKLMAECKLKESFADLSDVELLAMLIDKYNNNFKTNAALRKWQINDDMKRSIEGIIIGMTPTTRAIIRTHLDFNKWEESGPSSTQICYDFFSWGGLVATKLICFAFFAEEDTMKAS